MNNEDTNMVIIGEQEELPSYTTTSAEGLTIIEEDEFDKRLIERYKEGFTGGFRKGFAEGSYQVYDKIIAMLHEGKTVKEIENDDLFSDFTFSA